MGPPGVCLSFFLSPPLRCKVHTVTTNTAAPGTRKGAQTIQRVGLQVANAHPARKPLAFILRFFWRRVDNFSSKGLRSLNNIKKFA